MHVKMTRIESRVTVPKGLFTLYMNVKRMTAKIYYYWEQITLGVKVS
jgi:hypothetical protein